METQFYYEHPEFNMMLCPFPMVSKRITYVDIRENPDDEFPMLLKLLWDEPITFKYRIMNHQMFERGCVVTLTIRKKDYEKALEFIKATPYKVNFFHPELSDEYERVVKKVEAILSD